ncbi:Reticulocyte-binding protein 2-like a [Durusdinium trenchii]|uniref:Reticulocyte-binding protein 2-like a n=1 Tax=Durusdinium trenchii TaxID=1381693 RepID=A0ABP0QWT9_9DINO
MSYLLMQEEAQCRLQACAQDTECQEATWRPLARQVDDALKCKADRLLLTSSGLGNGEKEVVSKSITIEATPGCETFLVCLGFFYFLQHVSLFAARLPLPAILNCGLATRQPGRGPQTVLTLRRVRLQRPDQSQPLLEVGAGTACELYDCFVEGGIKLCEGARAKLIRTQIQGFGGAGISGRAFNCLSLLACTISDCADDGLLLRHGKADVVDCTINNSGQSGLVFGPGQWQLMGSTVSGSGQYGLWAEADAMVSCRDNVFADNALGDTGGRGVLKGWRAGFGLLPDSQCRVWCEQRAKWLPGRVVAVTDQVAVAVAKRFRKAKLGEESKAWETMSNRSASAIEACSGSTLGTNARRSE